MRPGGIEGGFRDQHDEIVVATRYKVGAYGFALKYLHRAAVDTGGGGMHGARHIERHRGAEGPFGSEGEAGDRFEHEFWIDGAFNAEIVECEFRPVDGGTISS